MPLLSCVWQDKKKFRVGYNTHEATAAIVKSSKLEAELQQEDCDNFLFTQVCLSSLQKYIPQKQEDILHRIPKQDRTN